MALHAEIIPGGKARIFDPRRYDPIQLKVGTAIETEHTTSRAAAREIAMDHLTEDPTYYTTLCRWHREPACRPLLGSALGSPITFGEVVNRYTIGHVAVGTILGLVRLPWWGALGMTLAWELGEKGLKAAFPDAFPNPRQDSWANSLADSSAVMLGWGLMHLFPGERGRNP